MGGKFSAGLVNPDVPDVRTEPRGWMIERLRGTVREAIMDGRLKPGQRLIESALGTEFGVSRPSVRTALAGLAAEGLLEFNPNRGAIVRRIRKREILDRYVIREALECLSARLAAQNMSDARSRDALAKAIEPSPDQGFDVQARRDENRRFHQALAEASGNGELWGALLGVMLPTEMVLLKQQNDANVEYWEAARTEHAAIGTAVMAGDPDIAEILMRRHVRRVRDGLADLPPAVFGVS